jgi:hypothetical protein
LSLRFREPEELKDVTSLLLLFSIMPTFFDVHDLGKMTEEQLMQVLNIPKDEFSVTTKKNAIQQGSELALLHSRRT